MPEMDCRGSGGRREKGSARVPAARGVARDHAERGLRGRDALRDRGRRLHLGRDGAEAANTNEVYL